MTQAQMRDKLNELGYAMIDCREALCLTNFNFEESKELLYLYTISNMHITYELLKLMKRVEKLEKDHKE